MANSGVDPDEDYKAVQLLRIISCLESSYHHLRINDFDEDRNTVREMCDRYYKIYFKLCKEIGRNPYG